MDGLTPDKFTMVTEKTSCHICNSPKNSPVYHDNRLVVVQCSNCGLVYQSESKILSSPDRFYQESKLTDVQAPASMDKYKDIIDFICSKYPGGKLLDVGAGIGSLISILSKKGINCTGLEPSKEQADYAHALGLKVVNEFLIEDLFPKKSFDVITLIQVLEHLPDPTHSLKIASQYLRENGTIIISVPSYNNPRFLLYRATGLKTLVKRDFIAPHLFYYTPDTLQKIVKAAGLVLDNLQCGRYSVKFGNSFLFSQVDKLTTALKIGGIVAYARKAG